MTTASPGVPLWAVRAVGGLSALALVGVVGWRAVSSGAVGGNSEEVVVQQEVTVIARRTARVTVRVDGELALEGELLGGAEHTFRGADRIEVAVDSVDAVRIAHNGAAVRPQGRQDRPRTLVFVPELGAAP